MLPFDRLKNRNHFGDWLNSVGLLGLGMEIGVAYGENAENILRQWKGCGLFLVDPWDIKKCGEYIDPINSHDFDRAFSICVRQLEKFPLRSIALRMTSNEALKLIPKETLDFCYIDGNHHEPQITSDITAWWERVRVGGVLGGHDYYDTDTKEYKCEVKSAVDKFVKQRSLFLHTTVDQQTHEASWWLERV